MENSNSPIGGQQAMSAEQSKAKVTDVWNSFLNRSNPQISGENKEASGSSAPSEANAAPAEAPEASAESESQETTGVSEDNQASSEAPQGDFEELILTDESGQRKKIKWDFADREKTKKAVLMAAGARKWQAERDGFKSKLEGTSKELTEYKNVWTAVEKAYETTGIEGIVNLLAGRQDAYSQWEEARVEQILRKRQASPSELRQIELEEREANAAKRAEKAERDRDSVVNTIKQEKEAAQKAALEGLVHPAFYKYSFTGKLGDERAEEMFNQQVWNSAKANLEAYPEGTNLTQEIVDKEFRQASATIRKYIDKQGDAKAKSVLDNKKAVAATKVAAKASQIVTKNTVEDEIKKGMRGGNLADSLKAFLSGKLK